MTPNVKDKLKSLAEAKMVFHRKLCLIQIFFSSIWATTIFHFLWALPFPVKIYPIEIFTRATPGSSLVFYKISIFHEVLLMVVAKGDVKSRDQYQRAAYLWTSSLWVLILKEELSTFEHFPLISEWKEKSCVSPNSANKLTLKSDLTLVFQYVSGSDWY